jgi:hypothetical protein
MCCGVRYTINGQELCIRFAQASARLPVTTTSGRPCLVAWGRRQWQPGQLPLGGWARLDSIYAGRWDRWFPVPVKIPVDGFMERDIEGRERWHTLTRGNWIQGLVARERHERRIYVVTLEPELMDAVYERWPRIMSG